MSMTRLACAGMLLTLLTASPGAVEAELGFAAIDEALTLGRSTLGTARTRFHAEYRLMVARAPVDYVEIVTPFRRVVLATQSTLAGGQRRFGQRDALDLLASVPHQMDVYVALTFHPLNTYIGVPAYDVALVGARGAQVRPASMARLPRFVPRFEGLPPPVPGRGLTSAPEQSAPLLGGTLVASFDLRTFDPDGAYDIAIADGDREIARVRVDFGRLR